MFSIGALSFSARSLAAPYRQFDPLTDRTKVSPGTQAANTPWVPEGVVGTKNVIPDNRTTKQHFRGNVVFLSGIDCSLPPQSHLGV